MELNFISYHVALFLTLAGMIVYCAPWLLLAFGLLKYRPTLYKAAISRTGEYQRVLKDHYPNDALVICATKLFLKTNPGRFFYVASLLSGILELSAAVSFSIANYIPFGKRCLVGGIVFFISGFLLKWLNMKAREALKEKLNKSYGDL